MDISATNEITAFLDIGSDGVFETEVPGTYILSSLVPSYKGGIEATEDLIPYSDIRMSQQIYTPGDTVAASVLRIGNPGPNPVSVEWKVWLETPFGSPLSIVNIGAGGTFVLPAGFDQNFGPLPL